MTLFQQLDAAPGVDFYAYAAPNGGGYTALLNTDTMQLTSVAPLSL